MVLDENDDDDDNKDDDVAAAAAGGRARHEQSHAVLPLMVATPSGPQTATSKQMLDPMTK